MPNISPSKIHKIRLREHFDTSDLLAHAAEQAEERGLNKLLVIDVDSHHYEFDHWGEIAKYIDNKVIKHIATVLPTPSTILNAPPMYQEMGDRIPRRIHRKLEKTSENSDH